MKTMLTILAAFAITAGISWSSADASHGGDRQHGAVAGVVTDENGHPVAGATVALQRRGSDRVRRTTTNDAGEFGFRHVRPGHYRIAAHKEGVGRDRKRIDVKAGEVTRVRLRLRQRDG